MADFHRFRAVVREDRRRRADLSHLHEELASLSGAGVQAALAILAAKLGTHQPLGNAETIVYESLRGGLGTEGRAILEHFILAVSRGAATQLPAELSRLHVDLFSHPRELTCLDEDAQEWLKLHPPGPERGSL